jgi:hypothetical protein
MKKTEFITAEEYAEIEQLRKLHDKYFDKFQKDFHELYKEKINNEFLSDLFFEKYGEDMEDEDRQMLWFEYILDNRDERCDRDALNRTIDEMAEKTITSFFRDVKSGIINPKKGN